MNPMLEKLRATIRQILSEMHTQQNSEIGTVDDVKFATKWSTTPFHQLVIQVRKDVGTDSKFYQDLIKVLSQDELNFKALQNVVNKYDIGGLYSHYLNLNESNLKESNFDLFNSGIVQYLNNHGIHSESQISTLQDVINLMLSDEQFKSQSYPNGYKVIDVINDVLNFFDNPEKALDIIGKKNPIEYANKLKAAILKRKSEKINENDFEDEGPQPGDIEYHYPGPSQKQVGIGNFKNVDWKIFHETLLANEEAMANGGRLPSNPNFYPVNSSDLTDNEEGLLTHEELQHLYDFDIVEINGSNPVILSDEFKDYNVFLNKVKEIWNQPAPRQDNSPSTLRYRDDGGTDGG